MPTAPKHRPLYVDPDVFEKLRELANPGETPNTVLRRALGLPELPQKKRSGLLKPFVQQNNATGEEGGPDVIVT